MKYSNDKRVVFNEESHSYFKGDKQLTSVTTFISQFKNKFDSDHWSKVIAKRENTTQESILAKWKEKAFKSTEIGTAIHKIFEDYVNGDYAILNNEIKFEFLEINPEYFLEFYKKAQVSISFIKDFFVTGRLIPVYTEHIVYNDSLAGQVDLICKDKHGNYYILDFKTNEKIETNSFGKSMIGKLGMLGDCSFYHYSLQLSIYKQIFKEANISKIFLVHIMQDCADFIECEDVFSKYNIDFKELINGKTTK